VDEVGTGGMDGLARWLVVAGVVLVLAGVAVWALGRLPFAGRLPGDLVVERDGFSLYVPIATSLILSLILTLVLNLVLNRR